MSDLIGGVAFIVIGIIGIIGGYYYTVLRADLIEANEDAERWEAKYATERRDEAEAKAAVFAAKAQRASARVRKLSVAK